ncbi:MAG: AAA family ATPase [Anaerolineales bacterium]|nr:AAA family ATPase [Anaerolineales bacterium]
MKLVLANAGYTVTHESTGKNGLISAYRDRPDFIVVELDLPDINSFELVQKIRSDPRLSRTNMVSLSSRSSPEEIRAALEVGLDEHIIKQHDAVDILLRYLAHTRVAEPSMETTAPIRPGRLITFMSAKGGSGTSTICLNTASLMAEIDKKLRLAVADLVLPLGSLSEICGASGDVGIVEITETEPSVLKPEYLRKKMSHPASWGFALLPGSSDPYAAARLNADRLAPVFQTLRAAYNLVVIDIGDNLSRLAISALAQSDLVIMVIQPETLAAQHAKRIIKYLSVEGIPPERFYLISNRSMNVEGLNNPTLESILDRPIMHSFPNMGERIFIVNNKHIPLHVRFPQDPAVYTLRDIASTFIHKLYPEDDQKPHEPMNEKGF